jgi:DNA polymerase-3 subunit epsilon
MREIVLDTETTGFDPMAGHRIVEVACIELANKLPTGNTYHCYFNPEMAMPADALDVHGLTDAFLGDKPLIADRLPSLLEFIGDAQIVAHNARFDIDFLNAELEREWRPKLTNKVVDTVAMARRMFPRQRASLDALCARFNINTEERTKHGALLDAELLAEVYLELCGGRQNAMAMQGGGKAIVLAPPVQLRAPRPHAPTDAELSAHAEFLKQIEKPLWKEEQ